MSFRVTRIVAPLAVLAASVGAYALLQVMKPEPEKSDKGPRPTSVYVAPVTQESVALQVTTQGEVRARTEIDLVAQVGGRVVSVSPEFTEGGRVESGVSLLRIEDTDYRLALRQAEARVAETEVAVQQALADADVARKQLRNTPNPSDLALKKPQVAQARASREAALANLEQARLDLARTNITLPFNGRVADTRVDVGQFIVPGTTLGRVFGTEVVEIRLPLNNAQLASLGLPIGFVAAPGEEVPVTFRASVAGRVHQWQGNLVRLDASVDPDTRMLYAIAEVQDPYGSGRSGDGMPLAVGLFVEATIQGRQLDAAVSIPGPALRAGDIVYLVNAEGRLEIRKVEVAHASAQQVVVSDGLAPGEQVVTSAIRSPIQGMALAAISRSESDAP